MKNTKESDSAIVPADKDVRDAIRQAAVEAANRMHLVPPVEMETLQKHARNLLEAGGFPADYLNFVMVVLGNEAWRGPLSRIPYDKRLLLLPQCLRDSEHCPEKYDQYGLLCQGCGRCVIDRYMKKAEALGYAVLVAEGSPIVQTLIQSGQIEAIVGVSCLSVLERMFSHMLAGAVPGMAVPLLKDGCVDTEFDQEWLDEVLRCYEPGETGGFISVERLKDVVRSWFGADELVDVFGTGSMQVQTVSRDWMSRAGKRWRPILTAGAYAGLLGGGQDCLSGPIKQAAVAVECFHKASLVHDDIEDQDEKRYDGQTLHIEYGVPIALNVGDYLLGQGYRLLTTLQVDATARAKVLAVAAKGHHDLCLGQGRELAAFAAGQVVPADKVVEIFALKTSPAFEVALKVGAILAGADDGLLEVLAEFSRAVGIAYQMRDDLEDWQKARSLGAVDIMTKPLSILFSLAYEKAAPIQQQQLLEWKQDENDDDPQLFFETMRLLRVEETVRQGMADYRRQALDVLEHIPVAGLKGLLRQVITRIFDDIEVESIKGDRLS